MSSTSKTTSLGSPVVQNLAADNTTEQEQSNSSDHAGKPTQFSIHHSTTEITNPR
jgi:hypothetical protein